MENYKEELVEAICLASYYDEDDYEDYLEGIKKIEEVKRYNKGHIYMVVDGCFDKNYFKKINNSVKETVKGTYTSSNEVFKHYGKPFTNGRDLWDFLISNYNFISKK